MEKDKEQEQIIKELREAMAKQSCDRKSCKGCDKTPLEKRWNIEEKEKPAQA